MLLIDEFKLSPIPEEQKEDNLNFMSQWIFLYKGSKYIEEIKETLSTLSKGEFMSSNLIHKNYLIARIFTFEVRVRREFIKFVELMEKTANAALQNIPLIYENNDLSEIEGILKKTWTFGSITNFLEKNEVTSDKRRKNNGKKISISQGKTIREYFFKYFKKLGAINRKVKSKKNFIKEFTLIRKLRNALYHHSYFFHFDKDENSGDDQFLGDSSIIELITALKKILSEKYCQTLYKRLISVIKGMSIYQENVKYYVMIIKPILDVFLPNTNHEEMKITSNPKDLEKIIQSDEKYNKEKFMEIKKYNSSNPRQAKKIKSILKNHLDF